MCSNCEEMWEERCYLMLLSARSWESCQLGFILDWEEFGRD